MVGNVVYVRELGTVELGRTGFDLNDEGSGENE